jgi:hypothetical protein
MPRGNVRSRKLLGIKKSAEQFASGFRGFILKFGCSGNLTTLNYIITCTILAL